MAVLIRNPYLEARIDREAAVRGLKTRSALAVELLIERFTQLEVQRGEVSATGTPSSQPTTAAAASSEAASHSPAGAAA